VVITSSPHTHRHVSSNKLSGAALADRASGQLFQMLASLRYIAVRLARSSSAAGFRERRVQGHEHRTGFQRTQNAVMICTGSWSIDNMVLTDTCLEQKIRSD